MPRLTGPCMSISASGKLADSIVFAGWKGIAYCRSWVVPLNKQSADQGDNRMIVGGIGRVVAKIGVNSVYHTWLITLNKIGSSQTKQSAMVKALKAIYMANATAFEAIYTAFEAHTGKASFTSSASSIGIADFDLDYKGTAHTFSKGMMLYLLARYAIEQGFTGAPYSTALASWTGTQTALLLADLVAVP